MPENRSNPRKTGPQLSDEQLSNASAGATEELKGAYNFLLEVAGTESNQTDMEFLKQRAARNG